MARALVHTCKRVTDKRIKHIWFPDVCAACKKIVDENTPQSEASMPDETITDLPTEAAPDELFENPEQLQPAEAAPDEGGENDALNAAIALLKAAGFGVVDATEFAVLAAPRTEAFNPLLIDGTAAAHAPAVAADGTPIATEAATIYERDFANGTAVKIKDATGVWYRYEGKRYNRCVSDVVEGERLIEGYRYLLQP